MLMPARRGDSPWLLHLPGHSTPEHQELELDHAGAPPK